MNVAFRDSDAKAWFESEPEWANRVGEGWKGTKILGRGSKGVAGLWEYRPENFDLSNAPTVKQMVVKMTELDDSDEQNRRRLEGPKTAFDEGNIGVKIAQIGSRHLVRQYGGNRLGDCFGEMGGVVKIFLEFCPGGDLEQFFPRNEEEERNPRLPIHEYDLWSLFHCMAVAIAAMERGTEDIKASSWNGELHDTEFMHCDLKMDNVFFGYRDSEHPRAPISKIGDFGEMVEVPTVERQNDAYGAIYSDRGADDFNAPEDCINWKYSPWPKKEFEVPDPRKGTCSNIWQIGAIMNCLMLRDRIRFNHAPVSATFSKLPGRDNVLAGRINHSRRLDTPAIETTYSKDLRQLVQECMLRPPLKRPNSISLVQRTRAGLERTAQAIDTSRILPDLPAVIARVPVAGLKQLDPPTEWLVDEWQFEDGTYQQRDRLGHDSNLSLRKLRNTVAANIPLGPLSPSSFRSARSSLKSVLGASRATTPGDPYPPSLTSRLSGLFGRETTAGNAAAEPGAEITGVVYSNLEPESGDDGDDPDFMMLEISERANKHDE